MEFSAVMTLDYLTMTKSDKDISVDQYRRIMGNFATGVTIVTTVHDGSIGGMTANAITSVSLEPMLLLFCADKRTRTHDMIHQGGVFAVNILTQEMSRASQGLFRQRQAGGRKIQSREIPHCQDGGSHTRWEYGLDRMPGCLSLSGRGPHDLRRRGRGCRRAIGQPTGLLAWTVRSGPPVTCELQLEFQTGC